MTMPNQQVDETNRPGYWLTFRPEPDRPDGPTAAQRIRILLKHAKRSLGLICIGIGPELPPHHGDGDPPGELSQIDPSLEVPKN